MQIPKFEFVFERDSCERLFSLDSALIESLARRQVVLFDTSVWIRLAESKDELSSRVLDKVLRLKDAERVFCPLTPPTIWELRKQTGDTLIKGAELMESLSENVTFRSLEQLFESEIESFLNYLRTGSFQPLSIEQIFGPLMSYLAPGYRISGMASILPPNSHSLIHTLVTSQRLTTIVQSLGDRSSPPFPEGYDVVAARRNRRTLAGNSIERARRIEMEYVAKEIVIPRLSKKRSALRPIDQWNVVARLDSLPKSKRYGSVIEHLLRFTPALSAFVEVQTISGLDTNRNDSPNDFFDSELLIYGMSYTGTFAAIDRWITSLIAQSRRGIYPAYYTFAGDLDTLERYLDSIG